MSLRAAARLHVNATKTSYPLVYSTNYTDVLTSLNDDSSLHSNVSAVSSQFQTPTKVSTMGPLLSCLYPNNNDPSLESTSSSTSLMSRSASKLQLLSNIDDLQSLNSLHRSNSIKSPMSHSKTMSRSIRTGTTSKKKRVSTAASNTNQSGDGDRIILTTSIPPDAHLSQVVDQSIIQTSNKELSFSDDLLEESEHHHSPLQGNRHRLSSSRDDDDMSMASSISAITTDSHSLLRKSNHSNANTNTNANSTSSTKSNIALIPKGNGLAVLSSNINSYTNSMAGREFLGVVEMNSNSETTSINMDNCLQHVQTSNLTNQGTSNRNIISATISRSLSNSRDSKDGLIDSIGYHNVNTLQPNSTAVFPNGIPLTAAINMFRIGSHSHSHTRTQSEDLSPGNSYNNSPMKPQRGKKSVTISTATATATNVISNTNTNQG